MFTSISNPTLSSNAENIMSSRSAKAVNGKPKGLSIRSESDRNISCSGFKNLETPKKDSTSKTLKVIREKQKSGLSPVSKSPHSFGRKKFGEEFIFKKPSTPIPLGKKNIIKEPETLAGGYYDQEKEFNQNLDNVGLDKEFTALILSRINCTIKPFEDDCLSEPEILDTPEVVDHLKNIFDFSKCSPKKINGPELPELSPL
ncbi:uncharacterized protein [Chelonus insularis]|uniref:uncharacterized protein n=1 Tax=Chelonus insularis TaxID=460826 RepID=UPI00158C1794|nr:uncharacterized protein LOC118073363 [Chelonus insularis]